MLVKNLVLASTSTFRQKLLASTGLVFETCDPATDEYKIIGQTPEDTAKLRCDAKGRAACLNWPQSLIISADQTLGFDGKTFDKPKSRDEARQILLKLQGRKHMLFSAVGLYYQDDQNQTFPLALQALAAPMRMRALAIEEIDSYLDSNEWKGCAGAYRSEEMGAHLFEGDSHAMQPDQSVIVGLPITFLLSQLRKIGINGLTNPYPPWTCHF